MHRRARLGEKDHVVPGELLRTQQGRDLVDDIVHGATLAGNLKSDGLRYLGVGTNIEVNRSCRRPVPGRRLRLDRPPGKVFNWLVAGSGLLVLWGASYPAAHAGYIVLAILIWMALAAIWGLRAVYLSGCSLSRRFEPVTRPRRFLYGPAIVIVAVALAFSTMPLHLRFGVSRPFLTEAAAAVSVGAIVSDQPVGLYQIEDVEIRGGSSIFTEANGGFWSGGGFAHLPAGPGAPELEDWVQTVRLRSMGGNWYRWVD